MDGLTELLLKCGLVMLFVFIILWGVNCLLRYFKRLSTS